MKNTGLTDYKNGTYCVESGYEGGGVMSVYILQDGGRAAIIDTGHNGALEPVKDALRELGIPNGAVDYIFLTHVHLDHAGGAGLFAREFPSARVVVHKRGARHIISPEKLINGAAEVYGKANMERLYGQIIPTPENIVVSPDDGGEFRLGGRTLVCLDTPGHARHHLAFRDTASNSIFTGDAFGMSYLELIRPDGRCAILTTSPVQFDPQAMRESMLRIQKLKPDHIYPTHFGEMPQDDAITSSLYRQLDLFVELAKESRGDVGKIRTGLRELLKDEAARQGCECMASESGRVTGQALELNAMGLALWYKKNEGDGN